MTALQILISKEYRILLKAESNLKRSLIRAKSIDLNQEDITFEQGEVLDSFSSKYMRAYEVLVNQVLRTALTLLNEYADNRRDNLNLSEKLGFISSYEDIDTIRILRNKVAHDYLEKEWLEIYGALITTAPLLILCIDMTKTQLSQRNLIGEEE